MKTPKISVIIAAYNSELKIEGCIKSLLSQEYPRNLFEIIVVDDGSKDKTVQYAKKAGADEVLSVNHCGCGGAKLEGAKRAKGEIFAFLDSDCEAQENWFNIIEKELELEKVITGTIENGNRRNLISWAEYFLEFSGFNVHRPRSEIPLPAGGNFAIRKEVYETSGGFQGVFSCSDALLGGALTARGIKCCFIPQMKIEHMGLTDKKKLLAKMKVRGAGFIDVRKISKGIKYSSLSRYKLAIPILTFGRIFTGLKYAIQARELKFFLICLPIIIQTSIYFCKGAWNELSQ